MLDLASLGSTRHHFAFGGAGFEIAVDPNVRWELSPEFVRHASRDGSLPVAATVRCVVTEDPALPDRRIRGVVVERAGDRTFVRSEELRAELTQRSREYEASAWIAPYRSGATVQGPDAVVVGLAAAIVEQRGGVTLHAAAIELAGRAVLFLGPSGAGKSTAVRLVEGARVFAFDRVSVVRDAAGAYWAWSLPGGARVDAPPSARRALPLAAALRVRQGRGRPCVHVLDCARAWFALRESTEVGELSSAAEELRLNAVAALASRVPVGELHTVLGAAHRELVVDFSLGRVGVSAPAQKDCCHDAG